MGDETQESVFRTPSGQTGRDAYIYETAQIANLQRELDARFQQLISTIKRESPETFRNRSDFAFARAKSAEHFRHYLKGEAAEVEWLRSPAGRSR